MSEIISSDNVKVELIPDKKSNRSIVWKYFGYLKKGDNFLDNKHFYCTLCVSQDKLKPR